MRSTEYEGKGCFAAFEPAHFGALLRGGAASEPPRCNSSASARSPANQAISPSQTTAPTPPRQGCRCARSSTHRSADRRSRLNRARASEPARAGGGSDWRRAKPARLSGHARCRAAALAGSPVAGRPESVPIQCHEVKKDGCPAASSEPHSRSSSETPAEPRGGTRSGELGSFALKRQPALDFKLTSRWAVRSNPRQLRIGSLEVSFEL